MITLTFNITEKNGTASIHLGNASQQPTELEIGALKSECDLGFARHADAMQDLAEAVLKRLQKGT